MPDEDFCDDWNAAAGFACGAHDLPAHARNISRSSPVDFTIEILNDLGTPQTPPLFRRCDFLAVVQHQRVRQIAIRIRFRFIVVGGIRRLRIVAVRALPERRNLKQIHCALMILLGSQLQRLLLREESGAYECKEPRHASHQDVNE